jgi:hypothetical protein
LPRCMKLARTAFSTARSRTSASGADMLVYFNRAWSPGVRNLKAC